MGVLLLRRQHQLHCKRQRSNAKRCEYGIPLRARAAQTTAKRIGKLSMSLNWEWNLIVSTTNCGEINLEAWANFSNTANGSSESNFLAAVSRARKQRAQPFSYRLALTCWSGARTSMLWCRRSGVKFTLNFWPNCEAWLFYPLSLYRT